MPCPSPAHDCILSSAVPYAWDEPTLPERLCVLVKGGNEPRQFDLDSFGPQGKVYYESYFCMVIKEEGENDSPQRQLAKVEFALDVPQGKAVILTKKVCPCKALPMDSLDTGLN